MKNSRMTSLLAAVALTALLGGLSACGEDTSSTSAADESTASATTSSTQSAVLSIEDPWIKVAEDGMTGAFGKLVNSGDEDIVVTAASSEVASMMELHETTMNADGEMAMSPIEGGFVIPAGGTHVLEPGADHLMVMGLTRPIAAGESVVITLTLEDGSTLEVTAIGKNFAGANEEYVGDDSSDMGEMSDHS